jgi:Holliday junction resolvasome RuvABC endonuclease subunit
MGIDLGISKAAWSVWSHDDLLTTGACHSNSVLRQHQLSDVSRRIREVVEGYAPDFVWIEDTLIGNNRKYSIQLSQMMGAALSALYRYDEVRLVNVSTWKKEMIGSGNAKKEDIREYVTDLGYASLCGDDQDRFDAAVIGQYGLSRVYLVEDAGLLSGGGTSVAKRPRQRA